LAKWHHLSSKGLFWLHTTSDEKDFYIRMYEILHPIPTAYAGLAIFYFPQNQKGKQSFFSF
jgi:hypothetical protein